MGNTVFSVGRARLDLVLALAATAVMAALAYALAGSPGANGIDDAAITRSYAQNIAAGHGFVYNVGGERVEGATSLLWTLALVPLYRSGLPVEPLILGLGFTLSVIAVALALRLARRLGAGLPPAAVTAGLLIGLAGLPGFFIWSVWSMMEIALWTALILWLLDRLTAALEAPEPARRPDPALLAAAFLLPLTRPEGVAVATGLALGALALRPLAWRGLAGAALAAPLSAAVLTLGRLAYFGQPFPNTYYAKVSADRLQNAFDGAKYLASFLFGHPFAEALVLAWLALAALAVAALWRGRRAAAAAPGRRSLVLCATALFGLLATYVMLGGDHFAMWRFYQPAMPLLVMPLALAVGWLAGPAPAAARRALPVLALAVAAGWVAMNAAAFRQERFRIAWEYSLSARGEAFGRYLNSFSPQPLLGVVAAGGIALTYEGEMRDLMGLNWVAMAHAKPIKTGMRNHASFDPGVFWTDPPQLIAQYHKAECQRRGWTEPAMAGATGVRQMLRQERFRATYLPVVMEMEDGRCTTAFAERGWLAATSDPRIVPVGWDDLRLLGEGTGA
ncbi:hypothetical protein [Limimaricola pyoseonensis]|nr:hypothetical protein [Limimaricola pyoseonensis]